MRDNLTGLRTHGQVTRTWVPPVDPSGMIVYDESDKEWADYAGLSRYKEEPVDLWDVRDYQDQLLGYTRRDPALYFRECRGLPYLVPILRPARGFPFTNPFDSPDPIKYEPIQKARLELRPYQFSFMCEDGVRRGRRFICWFTSTGDAANLAITGWIECEGVDCQHDFAYKLARKAYMNQENLLAF